MAGGILIANIVAGKYALAWGLNLFERHRCIQTIEILYNIKQQNYELKKQVDT